MYKLVISDDEGSTTIVPFSVDELSIGRHPSNTVRLTERNVSREHAKISRVNGAFVISDLKSYNGVRVNGKVVREPTEIHAGDEFTIGDYRIELQSEAHDAITAERVVDPARDTLRQKDEATLLNAGGITQPPKLVILNAERRGQEFPLTQPRTRVGRAPGLELILEHPSISREHAEVIYENQRVVIRDLRSINGIRVNGREATNQALHIGDLLELGRVKLRLVAGDATYNVDDDPDASAWSVAGASYKKALWSAGAILVLMAVVAIVVATRPHPGGKNAVTDDDSEAPNAELKAAAYEAALLSCQNALAQDRLNEAVLAGTKALRINPNSAMAERCKADAEQRVEDEQLILRAKEELAADRVENAYRELDRIPVTSSVRQRLEAAEIVQRYAQQLIDRANVLSRTNPKEAIGLLQAAGRLNPAPKMLETAIQKALVQAERRNVAAEAAAAGGAQATIPPVTKTPKTEKPEKPPVDPNAASVSIAFDEAKNCLARGDQRCAIAALEGRARTPRELSLLIETYRSVGETESAVAYMEEFIRRFPGAPQSDSYRQFLSSHNE